MTSLSSINLNISKKLRDKGYFHRFFRRRAQGEIAAQIKALREKRKFTQVRLAKAMKTGQSAIARIEDAKYSGWSFVTLLSVAEILDARLRITFDPMEDVIAEYEIKERAQAVVGDELDILRGSVYDTSLNQQQTANKSEDTKPFNDVAVEHANRAKLEPVGVFPAATKEQPFPPAG